MLNFSLKRTLKLRRNFPEHKIYTKIKVPTALISETTGRTFSLMTSPSSSPQAPRASTTDYPGQSSGLMDDPPTTMTAIGEYNRLSRSGSYPVRV